MSVKISINEKNLINNLRMAFSNSHTWVSELLQNARRAGATKIHIDTNSEGTMFTIHDDGKGIDDLQNLFTVAESGWDEKTQEDEHPYGMGFLSCLFVATEIVVKSGDKILHAITDSALDFQEIPITQAEDVHNGCLVQLHGVSIPPVEEIKKIVSGFPVPVFLNGAELPRPHAMDFSPSWLDSPVGRMKFPDGFGDVRYTIKTYLQGLPIKNRHASEYGRNVVVIHLDPRMFFGRLPDRSGLVNADIADAAIYEAVKLVHVRQLRTLKAARADDESFVREYGNALLSLKPEFLDDLTVLPSLVVNGLVSKLDYAPDKVMDYVVVRKEEVVSGNLMLFDRHPNSFDDNDTMAYLAYLMKNNGVVVDVGKLRPDHWVHSWVHQDATASLEAEVTLRIPCDLRYFWNNDIVLCPSVKLQVATKMNGLEKQLACELDDTTVLYGHTFYVPNKASGYGAADQASDYLGSSSFQVGSLRSSLPRIR